MSLSQQNPPDIELLHDGLTQKTTLFYTFEEGRRILLEHNRVRSSTCAYIRRDIVLHLPLFMTYAVWERYGYSLLDVKKTLEWNHTDHLYQLGLLYGISPSNSAVKVAFSSPTSLVFSSKAIIARKITTQLQQYYSFPRASCLDKIREDHVPALPIVHVDRKTFDFWVSQIPDKLNILEGGHWSKSWKFKDIQMVPFWMEKGAILMNRIIDAKVFEESNRSASSLATRPIPVTIGSKRKKFCGVEEACFMVHK